MDIFVFCITLNVLQVFFSLGGSKIALKEISGALLGTAGQIWRHFSFSLTPPVDLVNYLGFQKAQSTGVNIRKHLLG